MSPIEIPQTQELPIEQIRQKRNELAERLKALDAIALVFEESLGFFLEMNKVAKEIEKLDLKLNKAA